jgi:4-amino-4-deoxychorismate lyase
MTAIVINGALVDPERATVSVFDRGFQYGDGLFETVAVVRGEPLFWNEHLQRMTAGASVLGIPMPDLGLWKDDARAAIDTRCEREVLKLMLTRGVGGRGYGRPFPKNPTRVAYTAPWPAYPASYIADGIDVVTCGIAQVGGAEFATVKSLNRINQVLARAELPDDVPEGLLLDSSGNVREGTFTNVVWFRAGRAHTPRLTDAGIAGVMRAEIVLRLRQNGISCYVVDAPPAAIADSDECLVCNSLIGVWPVRSIDGTRLKAAPGPVTLGLLEWTAAMGLGGA